MLFSYIGAGSEQDEQESIRVQQEKLNLYSNTINMPSRATAGTVDLMPGKNPTIEMSHGQAFHTHKPQLLPVSCGYFFNIVRQLLTKQRKQVLRFILLDAEGKIFDQLMENIEYHSLTDLLVELMQISFPVF